MNPFFESKPPFKIKIYDKYAEITWQEAPDLAEDRYFFEKINSIIVKNNKRKTSLMDFIIGFLFSSNLSRKMEAYDEVHIELKTGETEIRYVHGQLPESGHEAIEMIQEKLTKRAYR